MVMSYSKLALNANFCFFLIQSQKKKIILYGRFIGFLSKDTTAAITTATTVAGINIEEVLRYFRFIHAEQHSNFN